MSIRNRNLSASITPCARSAWSINQRTYRLIPLPSKTPLDELSAPQSSGKPLGYGVSLQVVPSRETEERWVKVFDIFGKISSI